MSLVQPLQDALSTLLAYVPQLLGAALSRSGHPREGLQLERDEVARGDSGGDVTTSGDDGARPQGSSPAKVARDGTAARMIGFRATSSSRPREGIQRSNVMSYTSGARRQVLCEDFESPVAYTGYLILDPERNKVGRAKKVFVNANGEPEYITVSIGPSDRKLSSSRSSS